MFCLVKVHNSYVLLDVYLAKVFAISSGQLFFCTETAYAWKQLCELLQHLLGHSKPLEFYFRFIFNVVCSWSARNTTEQGNCGWEIIEERPSSVNSRTSLLILNWASEMQQCLVVECWNLRSSSWKKIGYSSWYISRVTETKNTKKRSKYRNAGDRREQKFAWKVCCNYIYWR